MRKNGRYSNKDKKEKKKIYIQKKINDNIMAFSLNSNLKVHLNFYMYGAQQKIPVAFYSQH